MSKPEFRMVHYEELNGYYKMSHTSWATLEEALAEARKYRNAYAIVQVVHKLMED